MRNIFILYMPPGNAEAMVHYEDTIRKKVAPERIRNHVDSSLMHRLDNIFQNRPIAVWGSRDSPKNRAKFDRMQEGDEVLIVEGQTIKLLGHIAGKTVNPSLSRELWQNLRGNTAETWSLVYFIANPREINLPFVEFCRLLGYGDGFQLRGFTAVSRERLELFYLQYDDLFSVLMRIKGNKPVEKVTEPPTLYEDPPSDRLPEAEEPEPTMSDHLRMQHLLLSMGKRAGEKVWAPRGDQSRITSNFQFRDFEDSFAAGLDTQVKYVENIDVVWKDEFRIDAAFEIENSTSIYSGLLRFADLTMVAPNTLYPMFIVAPSERRNRIREQLARPTFRHLRLAEKVRYLSYERVDEIDKFFGNSGTGLSVDVLAGKAECFPP